MIITITWGGLIAAASTAATIAAIAIASIRFIETSFCGCSKQCLFLFVFPAFLVVDSHTGGAATGTRLSRRTSGSAASAPRALKQMSCALLM